MPRKPFSTGLLCSIMQECRLFSAPAAGGTAPPIRKRTSGRTKRSVRNGLRTGTDRIANRPVSLSLPRPVPSPMTVPGPHCGAHLGPFLVLGIGQHGLDLLVHFLPLLGAGTETPVRRPSRRLAGGTPRRLRHFLETIEQNPLDLPGLLVRKRQLLGHALSHSLGPLLGSPFLSVRTLSRQAPPREQQYGCRDGHSYDAFHTFSFLYRNCKNSSVTLRTSRENREPENSARETPSGPRERLTQPRRETRCAPSGSNESGGNPPG